MSSLEFEMTTCFVSFYIHSFHLWLIYELVPRAHRSHPFPKPSSSLKHTGHDRKQAIKDYKRSATLHSIYREADKKTPAQKEIKSIISSSSSKHRCPFPPHSVIHITLNSDKGTMRERGWGGGPRMTGRLHYSCTPSSLQALAPQKILRLAASSAAAATGPGRPITAPMVYKGNVRSAA